MTSIIYLGANETMPQVGDNQPWITIEATTDGLFYGTGASWKRSGEWVGYGSLPEDDVDLERAIAAAMEWAKRYDVPTIWVQTNPE